MEKMVELMKKRLAEIELEMEVCNKQAEVWNDKMSSLTMQSELIKMKIAELEKNKGGD